MSQIGDQDIAVLTYMFTRCDPALLRRNLPLYEWLIDLEDRTVMMKVRDLEDDKVTFSADGWTCVIEQCTFNPGRLVSFEGAPDQFFADMVEMKLRYVGEGNVRRPF